MVQILLKRGEESLFLAETSTSTRLSDLTTQLATLHNDRKRLDRLVTGILLLISNFRFIKLWSYETKWPTRIHGRATR